MHISSPNIVVQILRNSYFHTLSVPQCTFCDVPSKAWKRRILLLRI